MFSMFTFVANDELVIDSTAKSARKGSRIPALRRRSTPDERSHRAVAPAGERHPALASASTFTGQPLAYEQGRVCEGTGRFPHYLEEGDSCREGARGTV